MFRYYFIFATAFLLFLFFTTPTFAQSTYVLPYPSAMPGSVWYKVSLVKEMLSKYWQYGDFGQFDYNLKQSDKYLVEAKILFDYKQYLLGYSALLKSDKYFIQIPKHLESASKNGKIINDKKKIFIEASLKHTEELKKMKDSVPEVFTWTPEKNEPTVLMLSKTINSSIEKRSIK